MLKISEFKLINNLLVKRKWVWCLLIKLFRQYLIKYRAFIMHRYFAPVMIKYSLFYRWKATRSTRPRSSCTTYHTVLRAGWSCSSTRATAACWRCTLSSSVVASRTWWSYRPLAWTTGRPGTLLTLTWGSPAGLPVCPSTSRWVVCNDSARHQIKIIIITWLLLLYHLLYRDTIKLRSVLKMSGLTDT